MLAVSKKCTVSRFEPTVVCAPESADDAVLTNCECQQKTNPRSKTRCPAWRREEVLFAVVIKHPRLFRESSSSEYCTLNVTYTFKFCVSRFFFFLQSFNLRCILLFTFFSRNSLECGVGKHVSFIFATRTCSYVAVIDAIMKVHAIIEIKHVGVRRLRFSWSYQNHTFYQNVR